jgi:hypothetical protein
MKKWRVPAPTCFYVSVPALVEISKYMELKLAIKQGVTSVILIFTTLKLCMMLLGSVYSWNSYGLAC